MFGILAKFFRFSGRENGNKFKLSIVIGLIEALASAMKIPAIMDILIGLLSGKPTGKYIGGSVAIMVLAIVVDVICKRYSTVLQTEGGYNASAFMRIKIAEHLRYLPMGYFNSNSIGEISSITTNTMEILGDVAARVVMLTMQGILETSMIILMLFIFDWRIGLIAAAGVLIFFGVNSVMQNAGKKDSEQKVVCDTVLAAVRQCHHDLLGQVILYVFQKFSDMIFDRIFSKIFYLKIARKKDLANHFQKVVDTLTVDPAAAVDVLNDRIFIITFQNSIYKIFDFSIFLHTISPSFTS